MTKVFLDYDQAELDRQYDQATLVPDLSPYHARGKAMTDEAKKRFQVTQHIAYGDHDDEWLETYCPSGARGAPVVIYFHGGAWRAQQAASLGAAALAYVPYGAIFVAVAFSQAPDANLDIMVGQCRAATAFVYRECAKWGGDPNRIHLLGHSSGAHLTSNVAVTDWQTAFGLPGDLVKGIAVSSGPYDLEPVILSKRNTYLHLDRGGVERNTAAKHLRSDLPPAIIAWGGKELAEFQRQAAAFADAWEAATGSVTRLFSPGNNHFDQCYDEIANADSHFAIAFRDQIGL
jgi:arylformamidase